MSTLSATTWSSLGPSPLIGLVHEGAQPTSGRVTGIAADPQNANIIYEATAGGGVWKTVDGGVHWQPLTDGEPTLYMGAVAVAPSDPNIVYAGTGESNGSGDSFAGQGLLMSVDAGKTWQLLGPPGASNQNAFYRRSISRIVVDPNDPFTVYVAVTDNAVDTLLGNTGIWKLSGGQWTNTTAGSIPDAETSDFTDLVMDPNNPNVLYAAVASRQGSSAGGIYVTTNGGGNWTPISGGLPVSPAYGRISLAISAQATEVLYAAIAGSAASNKSDSLLAFLKGQITQVPDGTPAVTWTVLTANLPTNQLGADYFGGQGTYNNALAVSPTNSNVVFVGGSSNTNISSVNESLDGGQTWTPLDLPDSKTGPHTDHHALVFDANGRLLDGNDGGIWRLADPVPGHVAWTDLNGNLDTIQFNSVSLSPKTPLVAYGGTQDNGTIKLAGGNWRQFYGGDGGTVRVDSRRANRVYFSTQYVPQEEDRPGEDSGTRHFLQVSNDGGQSSVTATQGINVKDKGRFYVPFVISPKQPSILVLGTDRVYLTTNGARQWRPISQVLVPGSNLSPDPAPITSVAISGPMRAGRRRTHLIYASAGGRVFNTANYGRTWNQVGIPGVSDNIQEVLVNPVNPRQVFAVRNLYNGADGNGHVFVSNNAGQTWTDISGNLPDLPVWSIAVDPRAAYHRIYVGTDAGVYASSNGGQTWTRFMAGMPNVQVDALELSAKSNVLAAATHGRGLFEIRVTPTSS